MSDIPAGTYNILNSFESTGLEGLEDVKLLNRVDTKFVIPVAAVTHLLEKISGFYRILEIEGEKIFPYKTVYLDTEDYLFFNQHVTGKLNRTKVRYRRYEQSGLVYLEVKRKTSKDRTIKWRMPAEMNGGITLDENAKAFIAKHFSEYLPVLKPALTVKFSRSTLAAKSLNERVTIDMDMEYLLTSGERISLPYIAIVELKMAEHGYNHSPFAEILKASRFYPITFSKYCTGMALLTDIPKKSILKPQLLHLNKIKNEFTVFYNA